MTESLERRAEELANEALAQHWDSGNYPVGPGISDSFRKNVGYAKDLAAIVLQLLSENRQVRAENKTFHAHDEEHHNNEARLAFDLNSARQELSSAQAEKDCPHNSETGDEGPVIELAGGHFPVRWRCDGCGRIRYDDSALADLWSELSSAQSTIAQQKEDLDRISAELDAMSKRGERIESEREAYREFIEEVAAQKNTNTTAIGTGGTQTLGTQTHLAEQARRILAENDR